MLPLEKIFEKARSKPRHIVLAEGEDPRIIDAALRAEREAIARITLLGSESVISRQIDGSKIAIINPETSDKSADYAQKLYRLRQAKGMTEGQAEAMAKTPLGFAAMMVREGDADGTVAGAVATTADVVRHALQIIGKAEGASLVSSFFLMLLCQSHHQKKGAFVFADCGLVVEPDSAQLADIAIQSADSYRQLTEKMRPLPCCPSPPAAALRMSAYQRSFRQPGRCRSVSLICASMENCSSTRHSSRLSAMPNRRTHRSRAMPTSLCSPISKPPISATRLPNVLVGRRP